jgi:hypothetical protein
LISADYLEQNRALHKIPTYGAGSIQYMTQIEDLVCRSMPILNALDYGCGKGNLKKAFEARFPFIPMQNYDPVTFPCTPRRADLVVCTDVLEHVEPECLDDVLFHLRAIADKRLFLQIATRPAKKKLPDGRNAHLIQEDSDWWAEKFAGWKTLRWDPSPGEIIATLS